MATRLVQIGHPKQHQYKVVGTKRHAVVGSREDGWTLLCTGGPATREYQGFVGAVECDGCKKKLKADGLPA